MTAQPKKNDWVFVAVENPGGLEQIVGYTDKPSGVSYIPVFTSKEDAQACFINLPRKAGKKYEIQAILFEELAKDALANTFLLFLLDGEGHIQDKIDPATVVG